MKTIKEIMNLPVPNLDAAELDAGVRYINERLTQLQSRRRALTAEQRSRGIPATIVQEPR